MKIPLTRRQIEALREYFDRVNATAVLGSPGMLVARLWHDTRNDVYYMEPAFLEHESAKNTDAVRTGPTR